MWIHLLSLGLIDGAGRALRTYPLQGVMQSFPQTQVQTYPITQPQTYPLQ